MPAACTFVPPLKAPDCCRKDANYGSLTWRLISISLLRRNSPSWARLWISSMGCLKTGANFHLEVMNPRVLWLRENPRVVPDTGESWGLNRSVPPRCWWMSETLEVHRDDPLPKHS